MHFYTYKITNLLNGKFYIGVHKTENLDDGYMGSGKALKNAIAKYGVENFKKDILMFHESEDDMFEIEALIVDQEFVDRKDTYNIKLGGFGGFDYINSTGKNLYGYNGRHENSITALKLSAKVHNDKMKTDHIYKSIICDKISSTLKNRWEIISHPWLGRQHTTKTKEKIKHSHAINKHQQGETNSQYGTKWIHNKILRQSKRIHKYESIPDGWDLGYILNWEFLDRCCLQCGVHLNLQHRSSRRYCDEHQYSRNTNEQYAIKLFNDFKAGNYKSVRDFCRQTKPNRSHVAISKMWNKYISEYRPV